MPYVDMPLDELKQYTGVNPKPEDFDQYWDEAIQEQKQTPSQVELEPSSFQVSFADCYELYFKGVGGSRIHAKLLKPKQGGKSKHPAVLMFHGYSINSGPWYDKLGYVAAGHTVAALDCRGQGGESEDLGMVLGNTLRGHIIRGLNDHPKKLLYRSIFLDAVQLAGIVMEMEDVDENRVGTMGGSQGGALTLACAALEPRIKRAAPLYPFLSDYRRVWDMDLGHEAYGELRSFFKLFDPTHSREQEIFKTLGYIDVQHLAPRIKARVMMGTGLVDEICPPSTQFAAYNKISARKEMVIYPDFGHEPIRDFLDRTFQFMMDL
jgi:cephalosporin-C deacetylase